MASLKRFLCAMIPMIMLTISMSYSIPSIEARQICTNGTENNKVP